jgi:hypothetical protein
MTDNEFINVPVPAKWVTKVFELVAQLEADQPGPAAPQQDEGVPLDGALTQALVERMYRESEGAHRRLLEYLAQHPDEWLDSQAVADGLGLKHGRKSLAGSLGAFGRRADHRYNGLKPFESRWDPDSYLARLQMSSEVAAWIRAAAAS